MPRAGHADEMAVRHQEDRTLATADDLGTKLAAVMNSIETVDIGRRAEWREWLRIHHRSKRAIWLVFYKKATAVESLSYNDSVEEALCFGWVDLTKREEAKLSRLAEALKMLGEGKKLGLKKRVPTNSRGPRAQRLAQIVSALT